MRALCFSVFSFLFVCFSISSFSPSHQQAFNATAVVRHMRRLQLGSSMGSSMDASNPPTRPSQTQKPAQSQSQSQAGQNQPAQSQNTGQAAQGQSPNTAASKTSSTDNNIAAPRKECEYESVVSVAPGSQENICVLQINSHFKFSASYS